MKLMSGVGARQRRIPAVFTFGARKTTSNEMREVKTKRRSPQCASFSIKFLRFLLLRRRGEWKRDDDEKRCEIGYNKFHIQMQSLIKLQTMC
jgi:hypothetical protein